MCVGAAELIARPRTASVSAPAKINLTLDVLGRRGDGFHEIESLVVGLDLCDTLDATVISEGPSSVVCDAAELETPDNLVLKAARAFIEATGCRPGFRFDLKKRIPVAAGLGGGSSDAAAALRLCDELTGAGLGRLGLSDLVAQVGSDVPLFFHLPAAVIRGRGEIVERVRLGWTGWVLVVVTDRQVSTAEVYAAWRPEDGVNRTSTPPSTVAAARSASELTPGLRNHLEAAVFRVCPAMGELAAFLRSLKVGPFRVSGAGSTMFQLFDERAEAIRVAGRIEQKSPSLRYIVAAAPVGEGRVRFEEP